MSKSNTLNMDLSHCSGLLLSGITSAPASSQIVSDASSKMDSIALEDGEILTGVTGSLPVASLLQSAGGLSIAFGPGSISMSLGASGGAAALVNVQAFAGTVGSDVSGTYTPTSGTVSCLVMCIGGGAGGFGRTTSGTAGWFCTSGGAGGSFGMKYYATAPSSATYTAGAGGVGNVAGVSPSASTTGGDTSFTVSGSTITAGGGQYSDVVSALSNMQTEYSVSSGMPDQETASTTGDFDYFAYGDSITMGTVVAVVGGGGAYGGTGGASGFGSGGTPYDHTGTNGVNQNGVSASGYGVGGSGVSSQTNGVTLDGGDGSPGIVIVFEYA